MIESPMVKELIADGERAGRRKTILDILVARFGPGARDLRPILETIADDKKLKALTDLSATAPDLDSFKKQLPSAPHKRK